jgi:hypothetical protein
MLFGKPTATLGCHSARCLTSYRILRSKYLVQFRRPRFPAVIPEA